MSLDPKRERRRSSESLRNPSAVPSQRVVSSITVEAVDDLGLAEGSEVVAVTKASDVMLATETD